MSTHDKGVEGSEGLFCVVTAVQVAAVVHVSVVVK